MFEKLADAVNTDKMLVKRGKNCSLTLLISIDDSEYFISIESGMVANIVSGQFLMRHWDLAIRASQMTWSKFWQKHPEPGFHDIFAMNRFGHCKIEGNTNIGKGTRITQQYCQRCAIRNKYRGNKIRVDEFL